MASRLARHVAVAVLAVFSLSGCLVLSVEPFSSRDVETLDARIEGTWLDEDGATWTFRRQGPDATYYTLTDTRPADAHTGRVPPADAKRVQADFEARLFRVGDTVFLDLFPDSCEDCDANDMWLAHMAPMHAAFRIEFGKDELRIAAVDLDHVESLINAGTLKVAHAFRDRGHGEKLLVLTPPSKQLQAFLRAIVRDPKAFGDAMVMTRQAARPPA
jgi:hypothetical protein